MKSYRYLRRIILYRTIMSGKTNSVETDRFNLQFNKVVIFNKTTRWESVQSRHPNFSDKQIKDLITKEGNDCTLILNNHYEHKRFEQKLMEALCDLNVDAKLISRNELKPEDVEWADAMISLGGDGTFLAASSFVKTNDKVLFGFNSNPSESTGYLNLPRWCSLNIRKTIKAIKDGHFSWLLRKRIRTTLHRHHETCPDAALESKSKFIEIDRLRCQNMSESDSRPHTLCDDLGPSLALNEVFIGEKISCRVSYLSIMRSDGEYVKTKSSGIIVCTGTGSTSWSYTMNYVSPEVIKDVLRISNVQHSDTQSVADKYNQGLVFNADDPRLFYTIRELIPTANWHVMPSIPSRGFVSKCVIKSSCEDTVVTIDGNKWFSVPPGTCIQLESLPSDSLRTIVVNEEYIK